MHHPEEGMMKREERLTRPQQYGLVYDKGSSWSSRLLVMRALPNNLVVSRYGLSVSKRVGNAVIRNRTKRRLKEILRVEPIKPGWDIVFIVRPGAAESVFIKLRESVENLLFRAGILEAKELSPEECRKK